MTIPNLEIRGNDAFALAAPLYVDNYVLSAGVAKTVNIPATATYAFFASNGDFYTRNVGTAAVPASDVTDGTGSELNPTDRYFGKGQTSFSLISPAATIVTIAWYR
jgi:hypothetical protein